VGALVLVLAGVHRVTRPAKLSGPVVARSVLAVAIVLESLSLRTALNASASELRSRGLRRFIQQAKAPELPTVLLEDMAALTGLIVALAGVTMATVTGNGRWDGAGSLAIGLVLGLVAVILAIEMKSLLIGEAASTVTERAVAPAWGEAPDRGRASPLRTLPRAPAPRPTPPTAPRGP